MFWNFHQSAMFVVFNLRDCREFVESCFMLIVSLARVQNCYVTRTLHFNLESGTHTRTWTLGHLF